MKSCEKEPFPAAPAKAAGMAPHNEAIRFAIERCSLGSVLAASSERGVCCILLGSEANILLNELGKFFPQARLIDSRAGFEKVTARIINLVEKPQLGLDLELDLRGSPFQREVWQALRGIPAGSTASYAEIAAQIGRPTSVRAVAGACAANRLAVAIPCHRVVRKDGGLSGYRWGIARKLALLEREAAR